MCPQSIELGKKTEGAKQGEDDLLRMLSTRLPKIAVP
jgi:hypothetical protein